MKKLTALICAIVVAVSAAACSPVTDDSNTDLLSENITAVDAAIPQKSEALSPDENVPVFKLNRLPDIGKYTDRDEKFSRFYAEHTDKLIPRDDYGMLIPFVGSITEYYPADPEDRFFGGKMSFENYGLCTLDGKIVVDAVYSGIYPQDDGNGNYYYVLTKDLSFDEKNYSTKTYTAVCSVDGSWMTELDGMSLNYIYGNAEDGNGRLVVMSGDVMNDSDFTYKVLDFKGNVIYEASVENGWIYFGNFGKDGLAPVVTSTFGENAYYDGCYIDINGNKVVGGFSDCGEFTDGFAVVRFDVPGKEKDTQSLAGIINTRGKLVIPAQYDSIFANPKNKMFIMSKDGDHYLASYSGGKDLSESIIKLDTPFANGSYSFVGKNNGVLHFFSHQNGGYHEFTNLSTGKKIVSSQLGASPNVSPNWDSDIFAHLDHNTRVFTFMDKSGKTLYTYKAPSGSSEYFNAMDERFITMYVDENYEDTVVIDLKAKKELGIFENTGVHNCIDGRFLILYKYIPNEDPTLPGTGFYSLYDAETGKYVLEKAPYLQTLEVCGKTYLRYVENEIIHLSSVSDGKLNPIVKVRNLKTD